MDRATEVRAPLMAQYPTSKELSTACVFSLRPEELEVFFRREHMIQTENLGHRRESLKILEKVGYYDGLMHAVQSDAETGIVGDVKDLARREKFFGENKRSLFTTRSFLSILWDQLDEFYLVVLMVLGLISLIISWTMKDESRWLESISIWFVVLFVCLIQALCDWGKEKQFLSLQAEVQNEKITVLRGTFGIAQTIFVNDLVVGDVISLKAGDRVPADCILVEEMDMKVDEKAYFPDDQQKHELAPKGCSQMDPELDESFNPDPVLLQDSLVLTGVGKAVVLAVGKRTLKEREITEDLKEDKNALTIEAGETPFQYRLRVLSEIVSAYAYWLCSLCLILFAVVWLLLLFFEDYKVVSSLAAWKAVELLSTIAALLLVCIPEGMPLVISMAMAFSVDRLKEDNLLIKNLSALELSGRICDIVTGKTGTVTSTDMEVQAVHLNGRVRNAGEITFNEQNVDILNRCLCLNNDAQMQMQGANFVPVGNAVDVACLRFVAMTGQPSVQDLLMEREDSWQRLAAVPFSADRKCMTVAYSHRDNPHKVLVVVKGSVDTVKYMAPQIMGGRGAQYLNQNQMQQMINQFIDDELVCWDEKNQDEDEQEASPLVPLMVAYKEMSIQDFEDIKAQDLETAEARSQLESDLTWLATLGIKDPLREDARESALKLKNSGLNLRIVSGGYKPVVLKTIVDLGLEETYEEAEAKSIDGDELSAQLDDLMVDLHALRLENLETFNDMYSDPKFADKRFIFKNKMQVRRFRNSVKKKALYVHNATAELKHKFTSALWQSGSTVGYCGEGFSDAHALREAHVGFAMGEDGCSAARDNADIVLMDDSISTMYTAIRYGRNVQENVRKFVQFQMTINFTCMIFVITNTLIMAHSPINVVQLLWINLIMDVLAAIAFATEVPPADIEVQRSSSRDRMITRGMMRQIISQTVYQLLALFLILYAGPKISGTQYNMYMTEMYVGVGDDRVPSNRMLHQTWIFQCFVVMNLFNMINCRQLDEETIPKASVESQVEQANNFKPKLNIFTRPFSNWWFWIIFFIECNIQLAMIGYPVTGKLFTTTQLTFGMHLTAIGLGLGTWLVCLIMRFTGQKMLRIMPQIGEDEAALAKAQDRTSGLNKVMRAGQASTVADDDMKKHQPVFSDDEGD